MAQVITHQFDMCNAGRRFFAISSKRKKYLLIFILLFVAWHSSSMAEQNIFGYYEQYDHSLCITEYHGNALVVEIPEKIDGHSVTAIDGFFVQHCEQLIIPDSVIYLGDGFSWDTEEYVVSPEHTTFSCKNGALFTKDGTRLLAYPNNAGETINIPEGTQIIDKNVFFYAGPQRIILPESLITIENAEWCSVFSFCSTLCEFQVSELSEKYSCVDGVLYDKEKRALIAYPAGKEESSFSIPDTIQSIGNFAFHGSRFTAINIPESITSCGKWLFGNFGQLQEVFFTGSGEQPLSFDEYAFAGTNLKTISLPSRTAQISDLAFSSSTIITCSAGTYIETWCQEHQQPFASYEGKTLEDGTLQVRCVKFYGDMIAVPSIMDGQPVSALAERAFWLPYEGLILPRGITFHTVILPEGLRTLRNEAFRGSTNLKSISLPASLTQLEGNPFNNSVIEEIFVTPGSPYEVRDGLFYEVDTGRLICCLNSAGLPDEYLIPEYIRALSSCAFQFSGFKKVTIPDTVIEAGDNPFFGCLNLEEIVLSPEHPTLAMIDGVLYSKMDKRLVCLPCALQISRLEVPRGIRMIGAFSVSGYNHITEVVLPDTVTSIGDEAFAYSTMLEKINLPDGLKRIGNWAFECCERLTGVFLPNSLEILGISAFLSCPALEYIRLPEGMIEIPYGAFSGCAAQKIDLPDSLVTIGGSAFYGSEKLESLHIPEGVIQIGYVAFKNCPNLTLKLEHNSYAVQYCIDNNLAYTYSDALHWLDE